MDDDDDNDDDGDNDAAVAAAAAADGDDDKMKYRCCHNHRQINSYLFTHAIDYTATKTNTQLTYMYNLYEATDRIWWYNHLTHSNSE